MHRRVLLVAYPEVDGLDLFGPAEVFSEAVLRLGEPAYDVVVAALGGGLIALTSGVSVAAADLASIRPRPTDIVLVAGGIRRGHRRRGRRPDPGGLARPGCPDGGPHRLGV